MGCSRGEQPQRGQPDGGTGIVLGAQTHVGMARSSNQDAYCAILAPNTPPSNDALLAVADGMGGHQAGEVASTMTIHGLVRRLSAQGAEDEAPILAERWSTYLREAIQQVNAEVFQAAAQPETFGMGSTLTAALVAGSTIIIGHVGDSRAYLLHNGEISQLTRDHSFVAEEVARGALSPEEARTHRRRNLLTRAMGIASQVEMDILTTEAVEGDTLLLCSDGLHSLVTDEEITRILTERPPSSAAQSLVDRANALGGNDNITVIVARMEHLGKATSSPSQRKDIDEAKTVQVRDRRGVTRKGVDRQPLRIALLLFRLPIRVLWIFGRIARATLRFPFGRRRQT